MDDDRGIRRRARRNRPRLLDFKDSPAVQAMLRAVRPAVVGLLFVVWSLFPKSVVSWHTGLIAVAAFLVINYLNHHPALAIVATAAIGLAFYR